MASINWRKAPKLTPQGTNWKPGEPRSYIPVLSLGRQPSLPVSGVVELASGRDGTNRLSGVSHGKKTEGTK